MLKEKKSKETEHTLGWIPKTKLGQEVKDGKKPEVMPLLAKVKSEKLRERTDSLEDLIAISKKLKTSKPNINPYTGKEGTKDPYKPIVKRYKK